MPRRSRACGARRGGRRPTAEGGSDPPGRRARGERDRCAERPARARRCRGGAPSPGSVPLPAAVLRPLLLVLQRELEPVDRVVHDDEGPAVQEDRGSALDPCGARLRLRVADAREEAAVGEGGAERLGIAAHVARDRGELVGRVGGRRREERVVHRPEDLLVPRPLRRLRDLERAGVALDGERLEDELHPRPVPVHERLERRADELAVRAREVGELDHRDGRLGAAERRAELRDVELRALVERGVVGRDEARELVLLRPAAHEPRGERRHPRRVAAGPVLPQALRERVRAAAIAERLLRPVHEELPLLGAESVERHPREGRRVGGGRLGRPGRVGRRGEGAGEGEHGGGAAAGHHRSLGGWRRIVHRTAAVERSHSRERGALRKEPGGKLGVALVYPNSYRLGMANLGLHTVYRLFNADAGARCERAFLPDGAGEPLTVESGRPLREFDVVAFSLSFEDDDSNVLAILDRAGLPLRAAERDAHHPLVVAGGIRIQINPEPVAPFLDVALVGEGEVLVPPFLAAVRAALAAGASRVELLDRVALLRGAYVPALYEVEYSDTRAPDR